LNGGEEECMQDIGGQKPEVKRPLGRPRHRWMYNIKMDLRVIGWDGILDQSGSGEGPVEGSCEQSNEPASSIICWEVLE
jgi:hypothetical protein